MDSDSLKSVGSVFDLNGGGFGLSKSCSSVLDVVGGWIQTW